MYIKEQGEGKSFALTYPELKHIKTPSAFRSPGLEYGSCPQSPHPGYYWRKERLENFRVILSPNGSIQKLTMIV